MTKNRKNSAMRNWAVFSGIGLQMGLIIFLGNLLGKWLDEKLTTHYLEEVLTLVAVFSAMFMIVYRVNRMNKK
ncbi:MAG: AtpZ/AtpI family protein [Bacteroidetes bacterium]|nr:AtpZ/AtpI family protein [Bacteroidota bacterium]